MTNPAIPVLLMALCIVIIFCAWAIYNLLEQIHDELVQIRHFSCFARREQRDYLRGEAGEHENCNKRLMEEMVDEE